MALTMEYLENEFSKTPLHRNLKTMITSLYGGETRKKLYLMEKLRIKTNRRVFYLNFLKWCMDNSLIPIFSSIKHCLQIRWNYKAFDNLIGALIQGDIRRTCALLDSLSRMDL